MIPHFEHSPANNLNLVRASAEQIDQASLKMHLPVHFEPYTDKYFLRSLEILKADGINPWVQAQIMIRKGPGQAHGVDEAIAVIEKYSDLIAHGGKIYRVDEGSNYESLDTLILIEGPIQDIIALETMYLGVLSAETTRFNDKIDAIPLEVVTENMAKVAAASEGKPIIYMGARHWRYDQDRAISHAAFEGGASSCSTDIGASSIGQEGVGTIPHVLENIYAWKYGKDNGVVEATKAFDRHIDPSVGRVALIDYNNREIDDSLRVASELAGRLLAVRVDTCGENVAQGALTSSEGIQAQQWKEQGRWLPDPDYCYAKYWYGTGVTVTGVCALRQALNDHGFADVKIILSSGFGDPEKVRAFVEAEKILGLKLFDMLGVGGVFHSRHAKMDIVAVGDTPDSLLPISKAGRAYRPNPNLKLYAPSGD